MQRNRCQQTYDILTAYSAQVLATIGAGLAETRAQHVVYSRTTALTHPVDTLWVNNDPDVMRSRQVPATARSTATVAQPAIV